jgi:enolase
MADAEEKKEGGVDETISERTRIESYLKQYCLEDCLDEAINQVVDKMPSNPYMQISRFMETKTYPEILDLKLTMCFAGRGLAGVEVALTTNIATFTASFPVASYTPMGEFSDGDMLLDFSVLQSKGKEALKGKDPTQTEEIDELIAGIPNITAPVAMAMSMACCRAGARHSGNKPLYTFLSEKIGTTARMPVPVCTVLTRAAGKSVVNTTQSITVMPSTPSFFDGAIESVMHATQAVNKVLAQKRGAAAGALSDMGCPSILPSAMTTEECIAMVAQAMKEEGIEGGPKLGLDYRSVDLWEGGAKERGDDIPYEDTEDAPSGGYTLEPGVEGGGDDGEDIPEKMVSGAELADILVPIFKSQELVTLEDPVAISDTAAVDKLQEGLEATIATLKTDMDSITLRYNMAGIGGDSKCTLQVVADRDVTSMEALANVRYPYNTVKLDLSKGGTGGVTAVLQMCVGARDANLGLVVGCVEGMPEVADTFAADLAVAVGADQYSGGGMQAVEYGCKYNRLVEIARGEEGLRYPGKNFRL